jgi:hypothetical protein
MQNNSNYNSQSWKQRLDAFEETESVDLNASWQKLQHKVPPRKSSSKKGWYWLAAACITGISFLLINIQVRETQTPGLVKMDTLKVKPETKSFVIENEPLVFDTRKTVTEEKKPSAKAGQVLLKEEEEPLLLLVKQDPQIEAPAAAVDTGNQLVKPVTAKVEKLKVVHINELNATTNNNALAQQEGKPYYPLSYKTKEVYSNAKDNRQRNDRDNIIKIRLFP